jgi:hypothetical protein
LSFMLVFFCSLHLQLVLNVLVCLIFGGISNAYHMKPCWTIF